MIQGKIKIEANFTGVIYGAEDRHNGLDQQFGNDPQGGQSRHDDQAGQTGQTGQAGLENQSSHEASSSNLAAMGAAQDEASHHWMLNDKYSAPVKLPPPAVLNPEVMANYLSALSNPKTGLLRSKSCAANCPRARPNSVSWPT
jgi:hypothetical protein